MLTTPNNIVLVSVDPVCYIVTRCTNLVSVHYFLPLAISAKMLINKVARANWACVSPPLPGRCSLNFLYIYCLFLLTSCIYASHMLQKKDHDTITIVKDICRAISDRG